MTKPRIERMFQCPCGMTHDLKYDDLHRIVNGFMRGNMQTVTPNGIVTHCLVTGEPVSFPEFALV